MDKYLDRLVKQLQDISEVVNAFESEAVQLKIVDHLLPILERNGKRNSTSSEVDETIITKPLKPVSEPKEKKTGLKKTLLELIQNSFFNEERSIAKIVEQLNTSGHEYLATQVSGILLSLVKEKKLKRYKNSINNRFVYIKP